MNFPKAYPQTKNIFPLVSMRKLEFTLGFKRDFLGEVASKAESYYKPFDDLQHGKLRHIDNPTGALKKIQGRIYKRILKNIPLPMGMVGGVAGKSIKDNVDVHVGREIVVSIDLKDCFPRVKDKVIFKIFREHLGCSEKIAKLLTRLTTYKTHLPQGAPTSTALANLSLVPMFTEIKKIASKNGLSLRLWVDDISLSGPDADQFIGDFVRIIQKHSHAIRQKKVKVMRRGNRQEVTGIVVNKKQSVSKEKIKDYKDAIFGLAQKGESITEKDLSSILGKIEFVRNINPRQARELVKLALTYLPLTESTKKRFLDAHLEGGPGWHLI